MVEQLRQLHALCLKHEDHSSAGVLARLLELHASDHGAFWNLLTANDVWGGAGSLADQCLMASRTQFPAELDADRKTVWRCLAEIAEEMKVAGRVNERTLFWASAFRSWLRTLR